VIDLFERGEHKMKSITLQVPDEVYEACEQMARKYGRTVEECVMEFMLKYGPKPRTK
jgi:3-dehydroquinate synthase class II